MNLVLLYPHFYFKGEPYSLPTPATGFTNRSLFGGSRQLTFKASASTTTLSIKTSVKTLPASQRQGQYLYVSGLNLVTSYYSPYIDVKGADNSGISTNVVTDTAVALTKANLVGANSDDFIMELTGAYKDYWEVLFTCAGAINYQLRKLMLGQFFYFGVEPSAPVSIMPVMEDGRRYVRYIDLRWEGVTNETMKLFFTNILAHREYNPVVLYARSWDGILKGEKLIYCEIDSYNLERISHDNNLISIRFKETI